MIPAQEACDLNFKLIFLVIPFLHCIKPFSLWNEIYYVQLFAIVSGMSDAVPMERMISKSDVVWHEGLVECT